MQDTTRLIEESVSRSNDGKSKLDHLAKAIVSITDSSERVRPLLDEVKLGSEEQATGIAQVAKALALMERVNPDQCCQRRGECRRW